MPRKKLFRSEQFIYHVTGRTVNREWFPIPLAEVWEIFAIYLYFITKAYNVQIHAFVLMDNHFHLLVSTPNANLDLAMGYLLREVSKRINEKADRINQVFGGPYHWTVIKNIIHSQHAYKYVYRNPVHAQLCKRVDEYPFSTLRGLLGLDHLVIPTIDNQNLIQDSVRVLNWLNLDFSMEDHEMIRQALCHREFQFPREESTGSLSHLELSRI